MKLMLSTIAIALFILSGYFIVINWAVVVNNHLLRRKWTSAIPLIGGVLGSIGMLAFPASGIRAYAWIPLFLDWGCLPLIVISFLCYLSRSLGKRGQG